MIAERVLPAFARGKEPDYWRICWDAQSPTEDFLICAHPDPRLKNLYLATGGSFHSYKYVLLSLAAPPLVLFMLTQMNV